ncbi:MAG: CHAT domain-containing protein [Acidobacteriota bacterium]
MSRFLAILAALWLLATPGVASEPMTRLVVGESQEGELAVGEQHGFALAIPDLEDDALGVIVEVEQRGIDIALQVVADDVEIDTEWRIDGPFDRDGKEIVYLPVGWRGQIAVEALGVAGPAPMYRIVAIPVIEPCRRDAARLTTEAGRGYGAGHAAGRRIAVARYDASVAAWRACGETGLATQGLYASGVIRRLLGEGTEALATARQVLPLWQALDDRPRIADTWTEIGLLEGAAGRQTEAREAHREALTIQEAEGLWFRRAATLNNLCLTHFFAGDLPAGIACYDDAIDGIRTAGDTETEATALTNVGRAQVMVGRVEDALVTYQRALVLQRAGGWSKREAETLNNLGALHSQVGEWELAREHYLDALEVFERVGARDWQARVLHNLADVYRLLGDPERAVVLVERALDLRRQLDDRVGEASALTLAGTLQLELGDPEGAEVALREALAIEQATDDVLGEAKVSVQLARAAYRMGAPRRALTLLDVAIRHGESSKNHMLQARAVFERGRVLAALDDDSAARASFEVAEGLFQHLGQRHGEAAALVERAALTADPDTALTLLDRALALEYSVAAAIGDADLRVMRETALAQAVEQRIELLLARGDVVAALETSEAARARGWLAFIQASGVDLLAGDLDPALAERLRDARRRLHVDIGRRDGGTTHEAEALVALTELEQVEAEIRRRHPDRGLSAEVLSAVEMQALLDAETVLLAMSLGSPESVLFRVSHERIDVFSLPSRAELERLAIETHRGLASSDTDQTAITTLAGHLLTPVLAVDGVRRVVVVADGALHYVPFAALPVPGDGGTFAAERWEIATVPSMSVLAAERDRRTRRAPAPYEAAVLADPVFAIDDPRLSGIEPAEPPADSLRGLDALPRLVASRREAEALADLVPVEHRLVALGFDAARELITDQRLADYRILHVAAHGIIDARYPALSGLVLSRFDAAGQPRDAVLRLRDVYDLQLRSDLVVLSACRTALGKEVRGEGWIGLSRGFVHAGASRVLASLWAVSDRATAELMTRFYRALIDDGRRPAEALRQAQVSMATERRWRDPRNWAGFVLIGDWGDTTTSMSASTSTAPAGRRIDRGDHAHGAI